MNLHEISRIQNFEFSFDFRSKKLFLLSDNLQIQFCFIGVRTIDHTGSFKRETKSSSEMGHGKHPPTPPTILGGPIWEGQLTSR